MAAAASAMRDHCWDTLLQPEAPSQRHDEDLPVLLRCRTGMMPCAVLKAHTSLSERMQTSRAVWLV